MVGQVGEECLDEVVKWRTYLLGRIMYVVAHITVYTKEMVGFVISDSSLQPRLGATHYSTRVHQDSAEVSPKNVMFVEQTCQLLVQCNEIDVHDSNGCEVFRSHLFSPRTVVADKKGKYSLQGIASTLIYIRRKE